MRVYEAIVRALEGIGVDAAFGGAGENAAQLMLALKHSKKIKPVMVRHEQAASFAACCYAMYSKRLGFCFATAGPGAFNLFSGLAVALSDSYPVLAVSGYASLDWAGKGALNETSGRNRTPDSRAMFAATTKRSYLLENLADTSDLLEEAVNLAFAGRPGPVHIHVPENLTHDDLPEGAYHDIRLAVAPVLPDPAEVAEAADLIAEALRRGQRVVALAGFGAVLSGAGPQLLALVERFRIPFATTLDGKGIIAEDHPLALGVFADSGHRTARRMLTGADVVLAVGNSFNQHATFGFNDDLFDGRRLVHINIDGNEINKVYRADCGLVADAGQGLAALARALDGKVGQVAEPVIEREPLIDPSLLLGAHDEGRINPGQMAQSLSRLLPDNAIVLADAGAHLAWLGYYLALKPGQNFRKPGSFGPMAWAVNGALGSKCAHPDRPVIVGCGDGCYNLSGFELMTAVENHIPVVWIIFDDRQYKLIKIYQLFEYQESGLVEFSNPDYVAYAKACGADGYRIGSVEEFEDALTRALASGRPTLIDAMITRRAIPHYSPSPFGVLPGIADIIRDRWDD